jgi:hypothetical protein
MAGIVKASINLNAIPKDKIIQGKKGKYLPITITINDEIDNFGNQGPVVVEQSKEEREAKEAKTYLGNVKVVWTNGEFPSPPYLVMVSLRLSQSRKQVVEEDDLPF